MQARAEIQLKEIKTRAKLILYEKLCEMHRQMLLMEDITKLTMFYSRKIRNIKTEEETEY